MVSAAKKHHFDALAFVKKSKTLGVKEELAEYQARSLEQVIDIAAVNTREEFNMRNLATKMDIHEAKAEIKDLRTELKSDICEVRAEIKDLRTELKSDICEVRAEIKDLRTELKSDICEVRAEIKGLRYDTFKFVVWTGVSVVVSLTGILGGLICKGFHWF